MSPTAPDSQISDSHKMNMSPISMEPVSGHEILSTGYDLEIKWHSPGPAAFDFRSDVVTTPTPSMLASIKNTTLLDDVFLEDPTTNALESFIASLTSKPSALLVLSGTMGNQVAIRTHLVAPPHSIICDSRSHIMGWEAGGLATLSQALCIPVVPSNNHHLTLEDVKKRAIVSKDVHACPTKLISLENTLGGSILPLEECRRISEWAHTQDPPIPLHLDGARVWEAAVAEVEREFSTMEEMQSAYRSYLSEYCACFDSVSLCFSKGLGAPIGSILVGSREFLERARHIRKSVGGGLRQAGVVAAPARVSVEETFLGGLLRGSHMRAKEIARMWTSMGGTLQKEVESNMVWLDLGTARGGNGVAVDEFVKIAMEEGIRVMGGRLVVHYQIDEEAVARFGRVAQSILTPSANGTAAKRCHEANSDIELAEAQKTDAAKKMTLNVE